MLSPELGGGEMLDFTEDLEPNPGSNLNSTAENSAGSSEARSLRSNALAPHSNCKGSIQHAVWMQRTLAYRLAHGKPSNPGSYFCP